jgi:hypothetical protein
MGHEYNLSGSPQCVAKTIKTTCAKRIIVSRSFMKANSSCVEVLHSASDGRLMESQPEIHV